MTRPMLDVQNCELLLIGGSPDIEGMALCTRMLVHCHYTACRNFQQCKAILADMSGKKILVPSKLLAMFHHARTYDKQHV